MYKVLDSYRRFDQKYSMVCRPLWDPSLRHLIPEVQQAQLRHMGNGVAGFELRDYALVAGASVVSCSLGTSINEANAGLKSWDPLPVAAGVKFPEKKPALTDPAKMTNQIKRAAHYLGADLVGVAKLDMRWVFSHHYIPETNESRPVEIDGGYQYVIAMGLEMDYHMMKTAPSALQHSEVRLTYSKMAFLVSSLAHFIRQLGYRAIPSLNDTALNVPIAVDAGLGELGRHGLLISPQFGPRQRLCKVITDMPLEANKPIEFGVTEFCSLCKKCARQCPSQAISRGEPTAEASSISNNPGVVKWSLSAEICRGYWSKVGTNCGICIRVCPFNKGKGRLHDAVRCLVKRAPSVDRAMLWTDDLFGYGKYLNPEVFWKG
jgi:reductive dehalogenase